MNYGMEDCGKKVFLSFNSLFRPRKKKQQKTQKTFLRRINELKMIFAM